MPGYSSRSDIAAHALTLQLPLEGKLARGGITGVIQTRNDQWIHCQQRDTAPEFFISTREVCTHSKGYNCRAKKMSGCTLHAHWASRGWFCASQICARSHCKKGACHLNVPL